MPSLLRPLIVLYISLALLPSIHGVHGISCAGGFSHEGDVYCRAVRGFRYTNVSMQGTYRRVVAISDDGSCDGSAMRYAGPMAPWSDELSLHLHGPIHLSALAVYTPRAHDGIAPEPYAAPARPPPTHTAYVPSPGHVLEQAMGDARVVAGRGVVFRDYLGLLGEERERDGRGVLREEREDAGGVLSPLGSWIGERVLGMGSGFLRGKEGGDGERCPLADTSNIDAASRPEPTPQEPFRRLSYYSAAAQIADNLVFLGHHDRPGEHAGMWDDLFGSPLTYLSADGVEGADAPQVLADAVVPSGAEVVVMMGRRCEAAACGFVRPRSRGYHGFGGADKVFLIEFSMPTDEKPGFGGDMPSISLLNAQIPRTSQYGPASCSCLSTGCGELDVAAALARSSPYLRSGLRAGPANARGGSNTDYIPRPTDAARPMKLAVVFDAAADAIEILVLPADAPFPVLLSPSRLEAWRLAAGGNVSSLDVSGKAGIK